MDPMEFPPGKSARGLLQVENTCCAITVSHTLTHETGFEKSQAFAWLLRHLLSSVLFHTPSLGRINGRVEVERRVS
jgi:hypothetical protein